MIASHGLLYVCLAMSEADPCVYHEPEYGHGHVAYSKSLDFIDLANEALNECETVHGDGMCELHCWVSREDCGEL